MMKYYLIYTSKCINLYVGYSIQCLKDESRMYHRLVSNFTQFTNQECTPLQFTITHVLPEGI